MGTVENQYPNAIGLRQALQDWLEAGRPTGQKEECWNTLTQLISERSLAAVRRAMATYNDRMNNAEDVAQEVMLRVIKHLQNPAEEFYPPTFQAYVATAAKNALIDIHRHAKRHKITLLGSDDEYGDPLSFIVDKGQLDIGEAKLLFDEYFERSGDQVFLHTKIQGLVRMLLPGLGPAQKEMADALFFGDILEPADFSKFTMSESRQRALKSELVEVILAKFPVEMGKDQRDEIEAALKLCIENRWPKKDPIGRGAT